MRKPRTTTVVTWPVARAKAEARAQAMLRVATQVIRVVAARLGSWAAVFIWFLLGGVGLYCFVGLSLLRFGRRLKPQRG
nr:MAG TPA: hypothetical protein [Caudoviricetes sp.]